MRPAYRRALRELDEARRPSERSAALVLAVAQRDLATARASSPQEIADEPGVTDPDAAYAAWVERMVESERSAHDSALSSVAAGYRDGDTPTPSGARSTPTTPQSSPPRWPGPGRRSPR